jgi:hypothetical protein
VQPQPVYYGSYRTSHRQGAWGDADRDGVPNVYDRDSRFYDARAPTATAAGAMPTATACRTATTARPPIRTAAEARRRWTAPPDAGNAADASAAHRPEAFSIRLAAAIVRAKTQGCRVGPGVTRARPAGTTRWPTAGEEGELARARQSSSAASSARSAADLEA